VAVIGNYLPRQCGIATFTTDLVEGLSAEAPERVISLRSKKILRSTGASSCSNATCPTTSQTMF
jgi:hypothetical protein